VAPYFCLFVCSGISENNIDFIHCPGTNRQIRNASTFYSFVDILTTIEIKEPTLSPEWSKLRIFLDNTIIKTNRAKKNLPELKPRETLHLCVNETIVLTSLLFTQMGVPTQTMPSSTMTPTTIGSLELKTY